MNDILAIVGSRRFAAPPGAASNGDHTMREAVELRRQLEAEGLARARAIIEAALDLRRPDQIISGGAIGVDGLAHVVAGERGIPFSEYLPRFRRWAPGGFRERNLLIASACTRLLCIRSGAATTYGSGWTADRAEGIGRPVTRHEI